MHDDARFQSTYIALVALAWDALERVDQRLASHSNCAVMPELQPQLQLLRLELLQLADKSQRLAESGVVTASQNTIVQRLAAKLLVSLALDATATAEVLKMRVWHAQNWLLGEARQWAQVAPKDCGGHEYQTATPFSRQLPSAYTERTEAT